MADAHLLLPPPILEFTFDITRMVAEMMLTETLQCYPRLKLVLSHLGGTLPWVSWRLSMLDDFPSALDRNGAHEPVRDQLRRLYFDVALSADPASVRMAAEVVGADRLLYGSDTPFTPDAFINTNTAALSPPVDGTDIVAAMYDNAERLFA